MAYINPQLQIDQQQQARSNENYKAIGDSIVSGLEENRKRTLENKRLKTDLGMKYTALGVNPTEEELDEVISTGSSKSLMDKYAPIATRAMEAKLSTDGAKRKKALYDAEQLDKPLNERDEYIKTMEAAKIRNDFTNNRMNQQEANRVEAEERSRARDRESKKYEAVDSMRKEITGHPATKDMINIDSALSKISTVPDSAYGDMSMIFSYNKLLDPGSTVREGEFANAEHAKGWDQKMLGWYNKAKEGRRLTTEQRNEIIGAVNNLAGSQYESWDSSMSPHRNRITELGVDQTQIMPKFSQQKMFDSFVSQRQAQQKVQSMTPEQKAMRLQELKAKQLQGMGR